MIWGGQKSEINCNYYKKRGERLLLHPIKKNIGKTKNLFLYIITHLSIKVATPPIAELPLLVAIK